MGTQRLDGLVCNAQGCLVVCTATLHISVTLGLTGANVDSFVDFSSQPDCHPSGWAMLASVDCQPDCGFQDVPTLAGTSRTPMAFKRVPSLATLVVEFQGVYNGQWGHADGRTPVIHCDTSRCIFSA